MSRTIRAGGVGLGYWGPGLACNLAAIPACELERKVTICDKGYDEPAGAYSECITRSGDIWSPRIANREPLRVECEHFISCVRDGTRPCSDGEAGLRVVRVLDALQHSLDESRRTSGAAPR